MSFLGLEVTEGRLLAELAKHDGIGAARAKEMVQADPEPLNRGRRAASFTYYVVNQYLSKADHECNEKCPSDDEEEDDDGA